MPTTFFGWVGFLAKEYGGLFLRGTGTTLLIAISGTVLGFLLGLAALCYPGSHDLGVLARFAEGRLRRCCLPGKHLHFHIKGLSGSHCLFQAGLLPPQGLPLRQQCALLLQFIQLCFQLRFPGLGLLPSCPVFVGCSAFQGPAVGIKLLQIGLQLSNTVGKLGGPAL